MVSPTISSPKVPPLSYADHAKKAQNIKSLISPQPHAIVLQSSSSTSGTSAPSSDCLVLSSKPVSDPPAVDVKSDPGTNAATLTDAHPSSFSTADAPNVKTINGDIRANNHLAAKALSVVAAHTSSQKFPVVNVWNVRKEQLAAARAALTKALVKETPTESQSVPSESALSQNSIAASKSSSAPAPNTSHGPSAVVNGVTSTSQDEEHDAFIVRTNGQNARTTDPLPPPVDDTDSWPEIGKVASAINQAATHPNGSLTRIVSENDQILASISRKNEKNKWVPIPPKELQAAADALTKPSKRQARKHTSHSYLGPRSGSQAADGSTSGSTQSQSRGHSASQSASHSRAHSRSESLQSSPRIPRERYLVADDASGALGHGAVNQRTGSRSSRPTSPPLVVRPSVRPPRPATDLSISPGSVAHPAPRYDQVGIQTLDDSSSSHPPSVQLQHFTPQTQQHYYHPTAHVPMHPQQNGHPSQSGNPSVAYPNPGAPYPIYSPYAGYDSRNSASHYGYWNTNQSIPGSGAHSPPYPQPQHPPPLQSTAGEVWRRQSSPPEQPQVVAGYKKVVDKEHPVVFGSIGIPGASQSPSPAPLPSGKANRRDGVGGTGEDKEGDEKTFTIFSIGVAPGDGPSRLRARTLSSKARSRTATTSTSGLECEVKAEREAEGSTIASVESKVIDLTDSHELKWEFGTTTTSLRGEGSEHSPSITSENVQNDTGLPHETLPLVLPSITGFEVDSGTAYRSISGSPPGGMPTRVLQAGTFSSPMEGALLSARLQDVAAGDDFEVKDFGYGFGPVSGTGRALAITREEREERERERKRELKRERMELQRMDRELQKGLAELSEHEYERDQGKEKFRDMDVPVRPRHGSYSGGAGYDRGERGVRRGRGMNGFGRGYQNRRGGFQPHNPQQQQQQQRQPFTVTPPQALFQPLQAMGEPSNGYYPQHRPPYIPPGYEAYLPTTVTNPTASHVSPPVPVPVTTISFPLDPTRWYLLGQLEYYLSPQNMAQDFFLRQQMDARGWVPVSLIASFNRIRHLTMDVHLVRDVLSLSSMVQVEGDWVRMNGWARFVLPNAAASEVEKPDYDHPVTYAQPFQEENDLFGQTCSDVHVDGDDHRHGEPSSHNVHEGLPAVYDGNGGEQDGDTSGDTEEDNDDDCEDEYDDDEEDVVFVMNHDDEGKPWPPERFVSS